MMTSLTTFPNELLMTIIDHVQDWRALYNFMQCSRYTHSLVKKYMYRNVAIQHRVIHISDSCQDCPFFQSVYDFTIQILRDPQRASLIKSLTLELYPKCRYPLLETVDCSIKQTINRSRYTVAERLCWVNDIKRTSMDALLAVLLPSLPQLERLEFKVPLSSPHCTRMLIGTMEQEEEASERPFQRLRHLGGRGPRTWFWADLYLHQLAHFLRMPSMESVAARLYTVPGPGRLARRGIRIDPSWELAALERGSSNVTSMELKNIVYDVEGMTCAIAACRNLKRLKIKILAGNISVSKFADLTAAVTQASQILETLSLTHRRDEYWHYWANETISSLHDRQCRITTTDFPKLRNLTLNMLSIFGPRLVHDRMWRYDERPRPELSDGIPELLPECLPPQIERLHLIVWKPEDDCPLICGVEALSQRVQGGQFDRLAYLRMDYPRSMVEGRKTENCRSRIDHMKDLYLLTKNVGFHFESNLI